ncbi:MAG: SIMPL domain-containing protein [Parvibaculaceae bacterium]|nr:SIMPL domain-containing protein [Parvibaculaceae bacterium]
MVAHKRLAALAQSLVVGASLMMLAPSARADSSTSPGSLTVTGTGQASATPDRASVQTGVVTQGATAAEALSANTTAMNAIVKGLSDLKIAPEDMQTSQFSVSPVYNQTPNSTEPPRITGYEVTNALTVTVKKIGDIGSILDRLVSLGSNRIEGINFSVSEPDALLDKARGDAVNDALRKAKVYAEAAGVALGRIDSITESGSGQPPQPRMMRMMAADSAVPVSPGQQTLEAGVTLVIDIQ